MKIAILFVGYARTFGQLKDLYKKHFPCDADVFMQIYDTFYALPHLDKVCATNDVSYTNINYFKDVFPNIVHFDNPKFDADYYKNIVQYNKLPVITSINQEPYRTFSFFDNIKKAINAKRDHELKNNFKYDYIIITRLDLRLDSILMLPFNTNQLTYPIGEGYYPNGDRKIGCAAVFGTQSHLNDQLMICNSDIANKIGNIYDNIVGYHRENIMINNETLIGTHCLKNKIEFGSMDIIKYTILR
jgi:hypothetical protein